MKTISIVLLLILLSSCKSSNNIIGRYHKLGRDFNYELELKADSTFFLSQQILEVTFKCNGKWIVKPQDIVWLECFDEPFLAELASGYMRERSQTAVILSSKKLKLGKVNLQKRKPLL